MIDINISTILKPDGSIVFTIDTIDDNRLPYTRIFDASTLFKRMLQHEMNEIFPDRDSYYLTYNQKK